VILGQPRDEAGACGRVQQREGGLEVDLVPLAPMPSLEQEGELGPNVRDTGLALEAHLAEWSRSLRPATKPFAASAGTPPAGDADLSV
jgi:hypothetical protein